MTQGGKGSGPRPPRTPSLRHLCREHVVADIAGLTICWRKKGCHDLFNFLKFGRLLSSVREVAMFEAHWVSVLRSGAVSGLLLLLWLPSVNGKLKFFQCYFVL